MHIYEFRPALIMYTGQQWLILQKADGTIIEWYLMLNKTAIHTFHKLSHDKSFKICSELLKASVQHIMSNRPLNYIIIMQTVINKKHRNNLCPYQLNVNLTVILWFRTFFIPVDKLYARYLTYIGFQSYFLQSCFIIREISFSAIRGFVPIFLTC